MAGWSIEGTSGDARFIYQPIDYTGDTPLRPGFYTYVLSVTPGPEETEGGWFDIRLIQDPVPE